MAFTEMWQCAAHSETLPDKKKARVRIPFKVQLLEILNNERLLTYPAVICKMIEL